jgi:hypothetical protein
MYFRTNVNYGYPSNEKYSSASPQLPDDNTSEFTEDSQANFNNFGYLIPPQNEIETDNSSYRQSSEIAHSLHKTQQDNPSDHSFNFSPSCNLSQRENTESGQKLEKFPQKLGEHTLELTENPDDNLKRFGFLIPPDDETLDEDVNHNHLPSSQEAYHSHQNYGNLPGSVSNFTYAENPSNVREDSVAPFTEFWSGPQWKLRVSFCEKSSDKMEISNTRKRKLDEAPEYTLIPAKSANSNNPGIQHPAYLNEKLPKEFSELPCIVNFKEKILSSIKNGEISKCAPCCEFSLTPIKYLQPSFYKVLREAFHGHAFKNSVDELLKNELSYSNIQQFLWTVEALALHFRWDKKNPVLSKSLIVEFRKKLDAVLNKEFSFRCIAEESGLLSLHMESKLVGLAAQIKELFFHKDITENYGTMLYKHQNDMRGFEVKFQHFNFILNHNQNRDFKGMVAAFLIKNEDGRLDLSQTIQPRGK